METHAAGGTQGGQDGREDADEGLQDELPEVFVLVFFFVWLILKMKRSLSFNEECFIEHLTPILSKTKQGKEWLDETLKDMKEKDIKVPERIAPMVYPVVDAIPMQQSADYGIIQRYKQLIANLYPSDGHYRPMVNAWMELTDNYSHAWIEKYVKLYPNKDNRLALLSRIETSLPRNLRKKHEDFLLGLRMHIESGQVVYRVVDEEKLKDNHNWIDVEMLGMREMLNPYTNELESAANQYKQERDEARLQCDELKKTYEMELARWEAKYDKAVKDLEVTVKTVEAVESTSKELSLTISEMAEHIKERFSKAGAEEFITMYYRLAMKHGNLDEETCKMIDGIIPYDYSEGQASKQR